MDSSPQERCALVEAHALKLLQNLSADRAGVADVSVVLEDLLAQRLGASAPGFRAKLRLVEPQLPEPLRRDLHYLATVRNDILHSALSEIRDPVRFVRTAKRSIHALLALETSAATTPQLAGDPGRPGTVGPTPTEGLAAMTSSLRQKKAFRLSIMLVIWPIGLAYALAQGIGHMLLPAGAITLVLALKVIFHTFLNHRQYHGLPGATDTHGEHRCLQCGHRGIHRSTIYKTDTTVASCSKCGLKMWAE